MYAKNVKFTSGFLCCSFVEGETKEPLTCLSNVFMLFLENKEKNSEKNTEKCLPIHL